MCAVRRCPVEHGRGKIKLAPFADPVDRIGRHIGGNEGAEFGVKPLPSGKDQSLVAALGLVARGTSGGPEHRLAARSIAFERREALSRNGRGSGKPKHTTRSQKAQDQQSGKPSQHKGRLGPEGPIHQGLR